VWPHISPILVTRSSWIAAGMGKGRLRWCVLLVLVCLCAHSCVVGYSLSPHHTAHCVFRSRFPRFTRFQQDQPRLHPQLTVASSQSDSNDEVIPASSTSGANMAIDGPRQPLKILLVVEPTPFNYISGYANRFQETLRALRKYTNDVVSIFTPDKNSDSYATGSTGSEEIPNQPITNQFLGFPIQTVRGFELFWYPQVTLTLDMRGTLRRLMHSFDPDIVHITMPSVVVFPALLWAKLQNKPVVISYHTDLIKYAQTYAQFPGSYTLSKWVVKLPLMCADLVLCTSPQLQQELSTLLNEDCSILRMLGWGRDQCSGMIPDVCVWQKGVNTEVRSSFSV
jgi:hypothetical protein